MFSIRFRFLAGRDVLILERCLNPGPHTAAALGKAGGVFTDWWPEPEQGLGRTQRKRLVQALDAGLALNVSVVRLEQRLGSFEDKYCAPAWQFAAAAQAGRAQQIAGFLPDQQRCPGHLQAGWLERSGLLFWRRISTGARHERSGSAAADRASWCAPGGGRHSLPPATAARCRAASTGAGHQVPNPRRPHTGHSAVGTRAARCAARRRGVRAGAGTRGRGHPSPTRWRLPSALQTPGPRPARLGKPPDHRQGARHSRAAARVAWPRARLA